MIFLYLHKANDGLDRSRYLEIMERPQACRILHTYWRRLTMVSRANGYYGTAIQGSCGVT